ncbi:MAG: hypothetical protein Q4P24_15460 [Rhodobacterales bacterium]|nr:hypothetical protein [Rhodobacterales bacterium]
MYHFRMPALRAGAVAVGILAAGTISASAATMSLSVYGDVANPMQYSAQSLRAFDEEIRTLDAVGHHGPVTYTGASLWSLLDRAQVRTDPDVKNDILSKYVVARGQDGYRAVVSMGELDPGYGGKDTPQIIAYERNQESGSEEGLTLVLPGDAARSRNVSDLVSLEVVDAALGKPDLPGGRSESFTLSGAVEISGTYDLEALEARDALTRERRKGDPAVAVSYTGVHLGDLLTDAGIVTDPDVKNDILSKVVVATGNDGYQIAYALAELLPRYGDPQKDKLVAYSDDAGLLGDDGFARLLFAEDVRGGRGVSNLVSLEVSDAVTTVAPVPLPGSAALLLPALGAIAMLRRRKKAAHPKI